jgi:hypothetical protein
MYHHVWIVADFCFEACHRQAYPSSCIELFKENFLLLSGILKSFAPFYVIILPLSVYCIIIVSHILFVDIYFSMALIYHRKFNC